MKETEPLVKGQTAHCDASLTLEKAGLSKTIQRMAVLESLIAATGPLNVRDILKGTSIRAKINRVTVYRILASFKEGGIIREITTSQGGNCYEMACPHNPIHPHFHCCRCDSTICMPPLTLSQAWDWFARSYNFSIETVDVHITGTCNRCRKDIVRNPVASARKARR